MWDVPEQDLHDPASSRWRAMRLSGEEFMRRFLQHVLPKGLHKVRYYGLWHPTRRAHAVRARLLLQRPVGADLETPSSETAGDPAQKRGEHAPCDERRGERAVALGHLQELGQEEQHAVHPGVEQETRRKAG
jgi:Putative transposase